MYGICSASRASSTWNSASRSVSAMRPPHRFGQLGQPTRQHAAPHLVFEVIWRKIGASRKDRGPDERNRVLIHARRDVHALSRRHTPLDLNAHPLGVGVSNRHDASTDCCCGDYTTPCSIRRGRVRVSGTAVEPEGGHGRGVARRGHEPSGVQSGRRIHSASGTGNPLKRVGAAGSCLALRRVACRRYRSRTKR